MSQDGRPFLFFGAGQASRSVVWCVADLLIGYHLVQCVGFSGRLAGIILFGSFALSALPDIFVATWLTRHRDPTSNALRVQAIFGVVSVAAAIVLFGPTPHSVPLKILYICAASAAFRLAYTVFDVSQNALISLLPTSRSEVRHYVTSKTVASSVGRLIAAALVFLALRSPTDSFADLKAVGVTAVPVIISVFGLSRVATPHVPGGGPSPSLDWRALPIRQLAVPMLAIILQVGMLGLVGRLIPLFESGRAGFAEGSLLVIAMVCGTVVGPALTYANKFPATRRLPMTPIFALLAAAAGADLLTPVGVLVSMGLAFAYGLALSAMTNIIWGRVAAIVAEHAIATGVRIDAPAFALLTTSIKVGIAISSGLFGVVLDGFKAGAPWVQTTIVAIVVAGGMGTTLVLAAPGSLQQQRNLLRLCARGWRQGSQLLFGTGISP